ncbi:DUF305 domain-containing protein [Rhizobium helianthi]|uniref:DUF305 domain-containing protein n=1 Tax=Rhizobium helianthi TaxID=1132695 RepID=A0ABW4M3Z2_9HYPH
MNISTLSAAVLALGLLAYPALAQDMKGHDGHAAMATDGSASTKAFEKANADMHKNMMITFSGKTDVDFVRSMIPHHQGAIDMARIELEHGKDPEIRKLAEEVIQAQEAEIKMMKEWLAKNDK